MYFFNRCFDKNRLKALILWLLNNSDEDTTLDVVEKLKDLGFQYATKAGLSLSIDDLKIPPRKDWIVSEAGGLVEATQQEFLRGTITSVETTQQLVDTWHRASEILKREVINHFQATDILNPVYMMAFSGARGNISQVRQLVGMRGLMADPQGQIIGFPIKSNFKEGLTVTEYMISCYGARKGLVDTALRTADAGYLTRRLVDVSQHVVVRIPTCATKRGILLKDIKDSGKVLLSLKDRLIGRVLSTDLLIAGAETEVYGSPEESLTQGGPLAGLTLTPCASSGGIKGFEGHPRPTRGYGSPSNPWVPPSGFPRPPVPPLGSKANKVWAGKENLEPKNDFGRPLYIASSVMSSSTSSPDTVVKGIFGSKQGDGRLEEERFHVLGFRNEEISPSLATRIAYYHKRVLVRSPLTCSAQNGICQMCYGWSLSEGRLVTLGEAVGIVAAQSIGEPGTQLTMRTFHTGGVFSGDVLDEIRAPFACEVSFSEPFQGVLMRTPHGKIGFLTRSAGQMICTNYANGKTESSPFAVGSGSSRAKSYGIDIDRARRDELLQVTTFELDRSTILFVRQGENVTKDYLLAESSSVQNQTNERTEAKKIVFSEIEGQVFFSQMVVGQIIDKEGQPKEVQPVWSSRDLGSIWILSGQHCQTSFLLPLYRKGSHLVNNTSLLGRAHFKPSWKRESFQFTSNWGTPSLTLRRGADTLTPLALPPELAHGGSKATPGQRGGTGGLGTLFVGIKGTNPSWLDRPSKEGGESKAWKSVQVRNKRFLSLNLKIKAVRHFGRFGSFYFLFSPDFKKVDKIFFPKNSFNSYQFQKNEFRSGGFLTRKERFQPTVLQEKGNKVNGKVGKLPMQNKGDVTWPPLPPLGDKAKEGVGVALEGIPFGRLKGRAFPIVDKALEGAKRENLFFIWFLKIYAIDSGGKAWLENRYSHSMDFKGGNFLFYKSADSLFSKKSLLPFPWRLSTVTRRKSSNHTQFLKGSKNPFYRSKSSKGFPTEVNLIPGTTSTKRRWIYKGLTIGIQWNLQGLQKRENSPRSGWVVWEKKLKKETIRKDFLFQRLLLSLINAPSFPLTYWKTLESHLGQGDSMAPKQNRDNLGRSRRRRSSKTNPSLTLYPKGGPNVFGTPLLGLPPKGSTGGFSTPSRPSDSLQIGSQLTLPPSLDTGLQQTIRGAHSQRFNLLKTSSRNLPELGKKIFFSGKTDSNMGTSSRNFFVPAFTILKKILRKSSSFCSSICYPSLTDGEIGRTKRWKRNPLQTALFKDLSQSTFNFGNLIEEPSVKIPDLLTSKLTNQKNKDVLQKIRFWINLFSKNPCFKLDLHPSNPFEKERFLERKKKKWLEAPRPKKRSHSQRPLVFEPWIRVSKETGIPALQSIKKSNGNKNTALPFGSPKGIGYHLETPVASLRGRGKANEGLPTLALKSARGSRTFSKNKGEKSQNFYGKYRRKTPLNLSIKPGWLYLPKEPYRAVKLHRSYRTLGNGHWEGIEKSSFDPWNVEIECLPRVLSWYQSPLGNSHIHLGSMTTLAPVKSPELIHGISAQGIGRDLSFKKKDKGRKRKLSQIRVLLGLKVLVFEQRLSFLKGAVSKNGKDKTEQDFEGIRSRNPFPGLKDNPLESFASNGGAPAQLRSGHGSAANLQRGYVSSKIKDGVTLETYSPERIQEEFFRRISQAKTTNSNIVIGFSTWEKRALKSSLWKNLLKSNFLSKLQKERISIQLLSNLKARNSVLNETISSKPFEITLLKENQKVSNPFFLLVQRIETIPVLSTKDTGKRFCKMVKAEKKQNHFWLSSQRSAPAFLSNEMKSSQLVESKQSRLALLVLDAHSNSLSQSVVDSTEQTGNSHCRVWNSVQPKQPISNRNAKKNFKNSLCKSLTDQFRNEKKTFVNTLEKSCLSKSLRIEKSSLLHAGLPDADYNIKPSKSMGLQRTTFTAFNLKKTKKLGKWKNLSQRLKPTGIFTSLNRDLKATSTSIGLGLTSKEVGRKSHQIPSNNGHNLIPTLDPLVGLTLTPKGGIKGFEGHPYPLVGRGWPSNPQRREGVRGIQRTTPSMGEGGLRTPTGFGLDGENIVNGQISSIKNGFPLKGYSPNMISPVLKQNSYSFKREIDGAPIKKRFLTCSFPFRNGSIFQFYTPLSLIRFIVSWDQSTRKLPPAFKPCINTQFKIGFPFATMIISFATKAHGKRDVVLKYSDKPLLGTVKTKGVGTQLFMDKESKETAVSNFQYLFSKTEGEIPSPVWKDLGTLERIGKGTWEQPLLRRGDQFVFSTQEKNPIVSIGQLLHYGDEIATNLSTSQAGQVIAMEKGKVCLRKGQAVLFYSGGLSHVFHGQFVAINSPLLTLTYQKLITGDIVQGIPKIEQFFEAPVTKDGEPLSQSLGLKLRQAFHRFRSYLSLPLASRESVAEVQEFVVEGIQKVYLSQGVLISDKHIEIIVRQMTSKGKIVHGGNTGLLPGEYINLQRIESINLSTQGRRAEYEPAILGITQASLDSESFISAASFQETTRVLSRDSLEGKTDFLRGLKERVVLGDLIQAGTGLDENLAYGLVLQSLPLKEVNRYLFAWQLKNKSDGTDHTDKENEQSQASFSLVQNEIEDATESIYNSLQLQSQLKKRSAIADTDDAEWLSFLKDDKNEEHDSL